MIRRPSGKKKNLHFIAGLKNKKNQTKNLLMLQLGTGRAEQGDKTLVGKEKWLARAQCPVVVLVRGSTLSALCKKAFHLSFLHGLTAFQKRFIQGQIGISVIANHHDQERWGTVSLRAVTSHFLGQRRSCFRRGYNHGCCSTPQSGGSLGYISTRHVLWDLFGCVQISRACWPASLQVGEPPFTIKADILSLLRPNSSISKADV